MGFFPRCFLRRSTSSCSLLSEKTSVQVSITAVRLWGCPTCQECASLTGVVTSMKTLDSPWLSQLPMNSDTGKSQGNWDLLFPLDHASVWGVRRIRLHCGFWESPPNLCFLICKVGVGIVKDTSSIFHCLLCLTNLYHQHHRIIETTTSLWVRTRWAEIRR